jgi:hypothetical protein
MFCGEGAYAVWAPKLSLRQQLRLKCCKGTVRRVSRDATLAIRNFPFDKKSAELEP